MSIQRITLLFTIFWSLAAAADVSPIAMGSKAAGVAATANSIISVQDVLYGGKTYRFVSMDSVLNGDLELTTILLVGTEVGGAAGYEDAFQLSPMNLSGVRRSAFVKAQAVTGGVAASFRTPDGVLTTTTFLYDGKTHKLLEK